METVSLSLAKSLRGTNAVKSTPFANNILSCLTLPYTILPYKSYKISTQTLWLTLKYYVYTCSNYILYFMFVGIFVDEVVLNLCTYFTNFIIYFKILYIRTFTWDTSVSQDIHARQWKDDLNTITDSGNNSFRFFFVKNVYLTFC